MKNSDVNNNNKRVLFDLEAITTAKLIRLLLKSKDNSFIAQFLVTYRTFMDSGLLLRSLLERIKRSKCESMRVRVCNILVQWMKFNWFDYRNLSKDESSSRLLNQIEALMPPACLTLIVKKKEKKILFKSGLIDIDLALGPPEIDCNCLFEYQITEIVKHLTFMELNLFRALELDEFIHYSWLKKENVDLTPNIIKMNKYFNHMVSFISTSICSKELMSDRVYSLARWIQIATAFKDMANYSGLMQIMASINSCAIHRLNSTFEQLKVKYYPQWETLEELKQICNVSGNFSSLKNEIKQSSGCIPLLSLTFHDLILTKEMNIDDPVNGTINFKMRQKLAECILFVRALQKSYRTAFPVTESKKLTYIIFHSKLLTEDELIARSKEIEPIRKPSPLSNIQPSPFPSGGGGENHEIIITPSSSTSSSFKPRLFIRRISSKKKSRLYLSPLNLPPTGSFSPLISPRDSYDGSSYSNNSSSDNCFNGHIHIQQQNTAAAPMTDRPLKSPHKKFTPALVPDHPPQTPTTSNSTTTITLTPTTTNVIKSHSAIGLGRIKNQ